MYNNLCEEKFHYEMEALLYSLRDIQLATPYPNHPDMLLKHVGTLKYSDTRYVNHRFTIYYYKTKSLWELKSCRLCLTFPEECMSRESMIKWFTKETEDIVRYIEQERDGNNCDIYNGEFTNRFNDEMTVLFEEFKEIQSKTPYPDDPKMPLKKINIATYRGACHTLGELYLSYYTTPLKDGEMKFNILEIPSHCHSRKDAIEWFTEETQKIVNEIKDGNNLATLLTHREHLHKETINTNKKLNEFMSTLFDEFKKIQMESPYPDDERMPLMFVNEAEYISTVYQVDSLQFFYKKRLSILDYDVKCLTIPLKYKEKEEFIEWFQCLVDKVVEDIEKKKK